MKDDRRSTRPGEAPTTTSDDARESSPPSKEGARKASKSRAPGAPKSRRSKPSPARKSVAPPKSKGKSRGAEPASRASAPPRPRTSHAPQAHHPPIDDAESERFFAEGDAAHHAEHPDARPSEAPRASELGAVPAVPLERRRAFQRVVLIAVGVCGALLVVAAVQIALALTSKPTVAPTAAAAVAATAPPPAPSPTVAAIPPPPPVATAAPPPPPAAVSAAPAPEPAAEAPAVPLKSAAEEKKDAQRALERGKTQDAIDAALRSTALDPTDADAWLILGASYLERGKSADARAAFTSCLKESKKGPVAECRSMLR